MHLRHVAFAAFVAFSGTAAFGSPFFADLEYSIGAVSGSSGTTDGGAAFAGGGVVSDVKFGSSSTFGGHVGYRLHSNWAVSIRYQHSKGNVRWAANFPLLGDVSSDFAGSATSNVVLGNLSYAIPLSDPAGSVRLFAGAGLAFNKLSGIVETDSASRFFLANVATKSGTAPAAQLGAGFHYRIAPWVRLGLEGELSYVGKFETGATRSGNLGVTEITPYRIDHAWRKSVGVTLGFDM